MMKTKHLQRLIVLLAIGLLLAACGKTKTYPPEMIERGQPLFISYCSSCHGEDAKGLDGKGKDLNNSEFIQDKSDEELLAYVLEGRTIDDPLNTTGIEMPPKGGNPAIKNDEILDILAYLSTFQE